MLVGVSVLTVVSGREVSEVTGAVPAVVSGVVLSEVATEVAVVGSVPAVCQVPTVVCAQDDCADDNRGGRGGQSQTQPVL